VQHQLQAIIKSPTAECPLGASPNVSTVIAKSSSDIQEQQPVDNVSWNDQSSISSMPCEKQPDSFYPKDNDHELRTGTYIRMYAYAYYYYVHSHNNFFIAPETQDQPSSENQDQTLTTNIPSINPNEQENALTMPTQVEDDDTALGFSETVLYEKHVVVYGKSQRAVGDTAMHESERELCYYRRELWLKEMELQFKDDTINRVTKQYAQLLRHQATQRQYQTNQPLEKYPMARKPHGIAVIINNYKFYSTSASKEVLPNRRGSLVDEDNLLDTLKFLSYEVRIFRNLLTSDITRELMAIALESHKNYDSFVCCILSHGYCDGIYGADSEQVTISDIANIFKGSYCKDLVEKPKLFFIQACRGQITDTGVVEEDGRGNSDDSLYHSLPSEADFLFGYATPPGRVSFRSTEHGSWYISSLCQVLKDHAHQLDLLSMLTIVNKEVCKAYTSQGHKQCPAPVSQLRKQVWFFEMPNSE